MRAIALGAVALVAAPSCATIAPVAQAVIVAHREPPAGCRRLGEVEGRDTRPGSSANRANAADQLRAAAAERGGNYVVVDEERLPWSESRALPPTYSLRGRLFRCPPDRVPPGRE